MIHDWGKKPINSGAEHAREELCLAANMPEATESHRGGRLAHKAMGSDDASGSMEAPEISTKSATAEQAKMTLKARKRTKTGCLSKFVLVTVVGKFSDPSLMHRSMPQAAHQVR